MSTPNPQYGPTPDPVDTSDFTPEELAQLAAIESGKSTVKRTIQVQAPQNPVKAGLSIPMIIGCVVAALLVGGFGGWSISGGTPRACKTAVGHIAKIEKAQDLAGDDMDLGDAITAVDQHEKYEKQRDKCLGK